MALVNSLVYDKNFEANMSIQEQRKNNWTNPHKAATKTLENVPEYHMTC